MVDFQHISREFSELHIDFSSEVILWSILHTANTQLSICLFVAGSCYAAQAGLKLTTLFP